MKNEAIFIPFGQAICRGGASVRFGRDFVEEEENVLREERQSGNELVL